MQTAAMYCMIGLIASPIIGVILALFKRTRDWCYIMMGPAFFFGGGWVITRALVLHEKGLYQTIGRTSRVAHIAADPYEATASFWFNIISGGIMSGVVLVGLVFLIIVGIREWWQKTRKSNGSEEVSEGEEVSESESSSEDK
ncbi:MAG: hypothetical protein M3Y56_06155 [Armatimonadota bacterium]|nr:hypothetical protein [Armatimonadota bacterium]